MNTDTNKNVFALQEVLADIEKHEPELYKVNRDVIKSMFERCEITHCGFDRNELNTSGVKKCVEYTSLYSSFYNFENNKDFKYLPLIERCGGLEHFVTESFILTVRDYIGFSTNSFKMHSFYNDTITSKKTLF